MSNEYLVKVTVRNNLILRQMKKLGIESLGALVPLCGLSYTTVRMLVSMQQRPTDRLTGEWTDNAYSLSAALRVEPEDLWTEKQRGLVLERNSREVSMSEDAVMRLASGQGTEEMAQKVLTAKAVANVLKELTPREQDILQARFFDGDTLEEIGNRQGVGKERIRTIEAKALRKLKHPSRSKPLRGLIQQGEYQ